MSQTLFLLYRPEPARPMSKAKSVGAHSICARGSLPYRKRARADMESAPTFFVAGGAPRGGGAPRAVFSLWSKAKSVGAHSICARGGLSCRKRARADMESAPTFFVAGGVPAQRGPRGALLPVVRASGFILLYFIIRNLQKKNDRLSSNKSRRFCRYFSGFVPKKCRGTLSLLFRCPSACVPQQNPAH